MTWPGKTAASCEGDLAALLRETLHTIAARYAAELGLPSVGPNEVLALIAMVGGAPSREALYESLALVVDDPAAELEHLLALDLATVQPDGAVRATTLAAQVFGRLLPITQRLNATWRNELLAAGGSEGALELALSMLRLKTSS